MSCIEHNQYPGKSRHGTKWYKGEYIGSHVYAYCTAQGISPLSLKGTGMVVRHKCDNPRCINPEHLEVGTQRDNMLDMVGRGRHARTRLTGKRNGSCKLTDDQIAEIRRRYIPRHPEHGCRAMGREFGVDNSQISKIVNHKQRR